MKFTRMFDPRPSQQSADEAQVRALIDAWAQAVRAKSIDGIVAGHAPDVLLFDSVGPPQAQGLDAYRASWARFFPASWLAGVCDISDLRIAVGHEVAFCSGLMRCGGIESDGFEVAVPLRLTMGFSKLEGEWTIVHEHCSEPLS